MGWFAGVERKFWVGIFWGVVQRRGGRVKTPEIGSRDGVLCFGGIMGFYAELRREFKWGNFDLGFFEGLTVVPRDGIEEGGRLLCFWGNF
jgi:hypothetical protein